jgi:hypothetical protein
MPVKASASKAGWHGLPPKTARSRTR